MPRKTRALVLFPLFPILALAGCQLSQAAAPPTPAVPDKAVYHIQAADGSTEYIVTLTGDDIPATLSTSVKAAGGKLVKTLDGMGVAVASSNVPDFAARLASAPGVDGVAPNTFQQHLGDSSLVQSIDPNFNLQPDGPDPSGPSGEPYSGYQWGLGTTRVPQAWAQGYTGKGVRVAVLDTGVDQLNPDLAPNLDWPRSKSFIPTEPTAADLNGHGSHVAGLIAAAKNGFGVIGVAPEASYFAVKVLDATGVGDDAGILEGIKYATDQGARILDLSIGEVTTDKGLLHAYDHAFRYANKHGAIPVVAAGNFFGSQKTLNALLAPAQANDCLTVSAVGPQGQQNFDAFGIYSDFGNFIDLAAPGGNIGIDPSDGTPVILDKRDFVLSDWSTQALPHVEEGVNVGPAPLLFAVGTSFAAPHVAGALALELQAHPGYSPAEARQKLLSATDDLGKPGRDPYFGFGRLDAGRVVQ